MKTNETKDEMFKRVAQKRVDSLLEEFRKLKTMANRSYYDYDKEFIYDFINEIEQEMIELKIKYNCN